MAYEEKDRRKIVAQNRKARYEYFIDEVLEAGIALTGSEVKSLRNHDVNINDAYVDHDQNEIFLINSYIPEYDKANAFNHFPRRKRKLLLKKRQIKKLAGALKVKGCTMVPLAIYFNRRNLAKVEIALARGKKLYDKREAIKQADWKRQKARLLAN